MSVATHPTRLVRPRPGLRLALAVLPVVAAAVAGSLVTTPAIGTWYVHLVKPSFNPPNWIFGPVWTVLYAMIAYANWRLLGRAAMTRGRTAAIVAAYAQLVPNALWSFAFFGAHSPALGLAVMVPLWLSVALALWLVMAVDRRAGWCYVPYLAWVSFAAALNVAIWLLNR